MYYHNRTTCTSTLVISLKLNYWNTFTLNLKTCFMLLQGIYLFVILPEHNHWPESCNCSCLNKCAQFIQARKSRQISAMKNCTRNMFSFYLTGFQITRETNKFYVLQAWSSRFAVKVDDGLVHHFGHLVPGIS